MNMKKKIVTGGIAVAMAATLIGGMSLAYFTDTDRATNTFTTGNVDITLNDVFVQDSKLFPGLDIDKTVDVTVGADSEDAYVRVHIAVPTEWNDMLTLTKDETKWAWEQYTDEIGGKGYTVYVGTYADELTKNGKTAVSAISKVKLNDAVSGDAIKDLAAPSIIVVAEGAQAETFDTADAALDAAFGTPGTYDVAWTVAP